MPFSLFAEGGICPPDTWAAGVAPSLDSPALVVLHSMLRCHNATVSKQYKTKNIWEQKKTTKVAAVEPRSLLEDELCQIFEKYMQSPKATKKKKRRQHCRKGKRNDKSQFRKPLGSFDEIGTRVRVVNRRQSENLD